MKHSIFGILLAVLLPVPVAVAQLPIAGTGQLPVIDPSAQSPKIVIDAIAKVHSNRRDKRPFLDIKACFRQSRVQLALRPICRQRLETYHREMVRKYRSDFAGIAPIDIQIRLIELSEDPDAMTIRRDLIALRGVIEELNEASLFRAIKECFVSAGAQPALQQICRQQLEAFTQQLLSTGSSRFRDIKPEVVRRRLLTVAMSDQAGFTAGDTTTFQSLRDIREAQREKRAAGRIALAQAAPYYCKPSKRRGNPGIASQLTGSGICICSYGRRYAASSPAVRNSPVRVAYRQCGPAGRFRVYDLNGGRLRQGDWVTMQTAHGPYVSMNRDGYVYGNRQSPGKGEKFRIIRATNLPGVIRSGEMVTLVSALGAFVVPDLKRGMLRATKNKTEAHEFLVFMPN
jgi:hypothetical protein